MTRNEIQNEALKAIQNRSTLAISMGVGKTRIALRHASKYKKILVVAPKRSIFESWENEKKEIESTSNIEYSTYLSLHKQSQDYDLVILDECHSILQSHEKWLKSYSGHILGLTGTPPRYKTSVKGILIDRYCPVVYKYLIKNAVDNKILNDYLIYIHKIPLSSKKDIKVELKDRTFYTSEVDSYRYATKRLKITTNLKELQYFRIIRMKTLMGFKSKVDYLYNLLDKINNKTIVFCNTQKQADELLPHSYHSKNKKSKENLQLFIEGKIKKLSCVLSLNEGVNVPELEAGVIMHSYSNERKTSQMIGRLLRLSSDKTATVHILVYKDTVDEDWVEQALRDFDSNKIFVIDE